MTMLKKKKKKKCKKKNKENQFSFLITFHIPVVQTLEYGASSANLTGSTMYALKCKVRSKSVCKMHKCNLTEYQFNIHDKEI